MSAPTSRHFAVARFRNHFDYTRPINAQTNDNLLWDNTLYPILKASNVWNFIRQRQAKVGWYKLLWHKLHVPRFSFISWLVFHKKLHTVDALIRFGIHVNPQCVLCLHYNESLYHMFFQCPYAYNVFCSVFSYGGWINPPAQMDSITNLIKAHTGLKITKQIMSLGLNVCIYKIWQEKNTRVHEHVSTPAWVVAQQAMKCRRHTSNRFQTSASKHSFLHIWKL